VEWGRGIVSEKIIDRINILQATKLAMEKALKDLEKRSKIKADFAIIDGITKINFEINQKVIVKADKKYSRAALPALLPK